MDSLDSFDSYLLRKLYVKTSRNGDRLAEAEKQLDWEAFRPIIKSMHAASVQIFVNVGEWTRLPPILLAQPGEDIDVPLEATNELMHQYQSTGGHPEFVFFSGEPHVYAHHHSPSTDRCNALVVDSIRSRSDKLTN